MNYKEIKKLMKRHKFQLIRINGSHHIFEKQGRKLSIPLYKGRDTSKYTVKDHLKKFDILINV